MKKNRVESGNEISDFSKVCLVIRVRQYRPREKWKAKRDSRHR